MGFKKGMLGKFVSKKQANIRKGKGKEKKEQKKPKKKMCSKKGLMDKKQRKMEFWKGRQKENKKINRNRKKRRILKTGLLGNKIEKNL